MQIICRAEARKIGQKTYFTGKPCANGHISYRYVQSGTCSQCINGNRRAGSDLNAEARRDAKHQLVQIWERCYHVDREDVAAGVWALAVMRFPQLTQADVAPLLLPKSKTAETALYAFLCHEEDIGAVRELARASVSSHCSDVDAGRLKAFGAAAKVATAPVPDWARLPRPGDPDYK